MQRGEQAQEHTPPDRAGDHVGTSETSAKYNGRMKLQVEWGCRATRDTPISGREHNGSADESPSGTALLGDTSAGSAGDAHF